MVVVDVDDVLHEVSDLVPFALDLEQLLLDCVHIRVCVVHFLLAGVRPLLIPKHLVHLHAVFLLLFKET